MPEWVMPVANAVLMLFSLMLGALLKAATARIERIENDQVSHADKLTDLALKLAQEYMSKAEFREFRKELFDRLDDLKGSLAGRRRIDFEAS